MSNAYLQESREDVLCVARQGELAHLQIANDFGISETYVSCGVLGADVEDGKRAGTGVAGTHKLREARKGLRIQEEENSDLMSKIQLALRRRLRSQIE